MYKTVKACVRTSTGLTDYFDSPIGLKQGCLASPILFSLFINELADIIVNSGVRGVQLFPDLTEILLLMFADDLALISDSVVGLQKLLNILYRFCSDRGMIINIVKTMIVVFKKGGMLARNETWSLGGEHTGRTLFHLCWCQFHQATFSNPNGKGTICQRKTCFDFYFIKTLPVWPASKRGVLQDS